MRMKDPVTIMSAAIRVDLWSSNATHHVEVRVQCAVEKLASAVDHQGAAALPIHHVICTMVTVTEMQTAYPDWCVEMIIATQAACWPNTAIFMPMIAVSPSHR